MAKARKSECISDDGGGVVDIMLCYHIFDDVDSSDEREREPSVYIFSSARGFSSQVQVVWV